MGSRVYGVNKDRWNPVGSRVSRGAPDRSVPVDRLALPVRGDPGPQGPMGPSGVRGERGPVGEQGPIGKQEPQGGVGPQGVQCHFRYKKNVVS